MYPRIEIKLDAIKHNMTRLVNQCKASGIDVAVVVKLMCGDERVISSIIDLGAKVIADSRLENFKDMKGFTGKKLLLRLPMLSQIDKVVDLVDVSLNSEIEIIRKISEVASSKNKIHDIILMVDLGDLREGIIDIDLLDKTIGDILLLKGIHLLGIGTNLTCFGGVIPSTKILSKFVNIKDKIEKKYQIKFDVVSGGNSGILGLLTSNKMPIEVNQLRLGASIFMGIGLNDERIDGLKFDAFTLVVEIIEMMDKPSRPIGEIGLDAFGNKPFFEDLGIRKKALCAIGRQDINCEDLYSVDKNIKILGMSSDHLVLDISDVEKKYRLGDKVEFRLSYQGVLSAMNSKYINKSYH
ncbi:alanine/ornithine racemase family PLP-dependent enzyme [Colwellia sp. MB02u-10]|jgi:predicted amino acid racemase|uniref:alanine/ornithine racemase family PLP-dependent enzyme n=1 Tax=Colwellia sp. MB02u-10 TaxID=2759828 RepID=UPI0015F740A1|nr:alanine/ornithine racemase family PLP-dependent enzyme [Colwellia sp. MB02u-10]MBA6341118.1 alanine/ornithine racemase family PLP-dependent enzyme [Colwellia sp. MB02u-10]